MSERYEPDDYSFEHYSDQSIYVGMVCSWSINDIPEHRPVVNILSADLGFNSDKQGISDEELYRLANRLQQAETGDATAVVRRTRRAVRATLRDYGQEALWWSTMNYAPLARSAKGLSQRQYRIRSIVYW